MPPDWFFDEGWIFDPSQNTGLDFSNPANVAAYDAKSGTDRASINTFLDSLGVSAGKRLIDIGAGTGALAIEAAKRGAQVIAVDVSPTMLQYIEQQAQSLHLDNIECVKQGFLTYAHTSPPVDFIYTRNALHHLPQFWQVQALARMHTMLKPGGTLALQDLIFSFEPQDTDRYINAWLDGAPIDAAQGWTRGEFVAHVREEYSTFSWLMEPALQRAGFTIQQATFSPSKIHAGYTCIKN